MKKLEKYFILNDDGKYYVAEGRATWDRNKALRIETLEILITTIPIMKDWNCNYVVYQVWNGIAKRVEGKVWAPMYYKWKKENPEDYEKLYSASNWIGRLTTH